MVPRERLLPAAYDLALRLGADPDRTVSNVAFGQKGRMRQLGASRWMAFRAEETISDLRCAFAWRARTGPFGMIRVLDGLEEDGGRLEVRAFGCIPMVKAPGSTALTRGELMRYLSELAWAPDAILFNPGLRWREGASGTLVVGAGSAENAAEVELRLDGQGRIAGTFAPDRPRALKAAFLPTPWRGRFSDYRRHQGVWLPFAAEVAWEVDGKEFVYWQGSLERWER